MSSPNQNLNTPQTNLRTPSPGGLHRQTSAPSLSSARQVRNLDEEMSKISLETRFFSTDVSFDGAEEVAYEPPAFEKYEGKFPSTSSIPNWDTPQSQDDGPRRSFSKKKNLRNLSVKVPQTGQNLEPTGNSTKDAARRARERSQSRLASQLAQAKEAELFQEAPPPSRSFALVESELNSPINVPRSAQLNRSITTLAKPTQELSSSVGSQPTTPQMFARDTETIDLLPYKYGPACILPYLYLGSKENAKSLDVVEELSLKYLINVAEEVWNPLSGEGLAEEEPVLTVEQVAPQKRNPHAVPIKGKKKPMGPDDYVETPHHFSASSSFKKTPSIARFAEFGVVREVITTVSVRQNTSATSQKSKRDWAGIVTDSEEVVDLEVKLIGRNTCFLDPNPSRPTSIVGASPKDPGLLSTSHKPSPMSSPGSPNLPKTVRSNSELLSPTAPPVRTNTPPNGPSPPRPLSISPANSDTGSPRTKPFKSSPLMVAPLSTSGGVRVHTLHLHSLHFPWTHGNLLNRAGTEDSPLEERPCRRLGFDSELDMAFEIVDRARQQHQSVLISCSQGVARSASLVIAYVMRTLRLDLKGAYNFVRLRAPAVMPDVGMMGRLVELETEWQLTSQENAMSPPTPKNLSNSIPATPLTFAERVDKRLGGEWGRTPGLALREGQITPTGERAGRGMSPVRVSFTRSFSPSDGPLPNRQSSLRSGSVGYGSVRIGSALRGHSISPPPPMGGITDVHQSPSAATPTSPQFSPIVEDTPVR